LSWPMLCSSFEAFFHFIIWVCYVLYIVIVVSTQYFCRPLLKGFHNSFVRFALGLMYVTESTLTNDVLLAFIMCTLSKGKSFDTFLALKKQ
jgi:hypothetical protein